MHAALEAIRNAIQGTPFDGDVYLVGGAVRDELLGLPHDNDFDLVTRQDAAELANLLWERKVGKFPPVTYPAFGTAMVQVGGADVELVTARTESYRGESRKPVVQAASYLEDAQRRDFTVNTLRRNLADWSLSDPLGNALADLRNKILRTPLDPVVTFHDDPLRMLRAVRFRWQLGFEPAEGLYDAIHDTRDRLRIISFERIRDEILKMLARPTGPRALQDIVDLGLAETIAPEFQAMIGVEQGNFHHLDVWRHTLLVIENLWRQTKRPSQTLILAALFHDVGKSQTRTIDKEGRTRFFGHETLGEEMTRKVLRRWKFAEKDISPVASLVRNHMRLGSSPTFSKSAARRLIRDLGEQLPNLLELVEADARSLKPGVRELDLGPIRSQIELVETETPQNVLQSPLTGAEIMATLNLDAGPEVGKWKSFLTERVLEGDLAPGDKDSAAQMLRAATKA
jgi:poly(A) polymerase